MKCWGANGSGQLGNNSLTNAKVPVVVSGLAGVTAIAAGGQHSCAVPAGGAVKCWGLNSSGQLGDNTLTNAKVPVAVSGLTGVGPRSRPAAAHSLCVVLGRVGEVLGLEQLGSVGQQHVDERADPRRRERLDRRSLIAAGARMPARCSPTGSVKCWGLNGSGQLGNNTLTNAKIPVMVGGLAGVIAITSGGVHFCALLPAGTVSAGDSTTPGQLGNASTHELDHTRRCERPDRRHRAITAGYHIRAHCSRAGPSSVGG